MIPLPDFNEPVIWHVRATEDAQPFIPLSLRCQAVAAFADFLLQHSESRRYPEIIALAFWFRAAKLKNLNLPEAQTNKSVQRVFHIAPANVDTVFLYSLLLSVLSGNQNVIRISERSGHVTHILVQQLADFLASEAGRVIQSTISIIEYSATLQNVTEQLSDWSDLRVVWGGDKAIDAISAIAPKTKQICFPDRYSIAILELDNVATLPDIARALLREVLPFNQQACSSPKAIYWLNTSPELQRLFWQECETQLLQSTHEFNDSHKVEQQILLQVLMASFAMQLKDESGSKIASFAKVTNIGPLARCKVKNLTAEMLVAHTGNGLLVEKDIETSDELAYSPKLQTISCTHNVDTAKIAGKAKRIVQLGNALEFSEVWDGVDLLKVFN